MAHKQILTLLKIYNEMIENYTFKAKWSILVIFRKMTTSEGRNRCEDLNSASIYSSYTIML